MTIRALALIAAVAAPLAWSGCLGGGDGPWADSPYQVDGAAPHGGPGTGGTGAPGSGASNDDPTSQGGAPGAGGGAADPNAGGPTGPSSPSSPSNPSDPSEPAGPGGPSGPAVPGDPGDPTTGEPGSGAEDPTDPGQDPGSEPTDPGGETPDACAGPSDPGRVTLRRLNRVEYDNTVRDLLGTDSSVAETFPADDVGYGFDNMADVLSVSPLHVEKYTQAAEDLVTEALATPETRAALLICDPASGTASCTTEILVAFASRAWRSQVTSEQMAPYAAIVDVSIAQEGTFDEGIAAALQAVLLSPRFLYRVELDPDPASEAPHALSDYELASRLSYLLWSSGPDETLLSAAAQGGLQDPDTIEEQVLRMLDDPRAEALTLNFAGQWLEIRAMDAVTKDQELFPEFDQELADAMKAETELFFDEFLRGDRSALDMLDADFTYVNDRLAAHYGIPSPGEMGFEQVPLEGAQRGGLLGQGSVLTVTSHPNRTSPVRRGRWVLARLLCMEPPPPPANVTGLIESDTGGDEGPLTVKELTEKHTKDPMCAGCHTMMDPIGFGLENYDATGVYRTTDAGKPIDPSGTLFTGDDFADAAGLAAILKENPEVPRCMAEHLLTYALGRGVLSSDSCAVSSIVDQWQERGYRLSDLLVLVAQSEPFRMRRGEKE